MKVKGGAAAHKERFCHQFLETHERYDPSTLPWPDLDGAQPGRAADVGAGAPASAETSMTEGGEVKHG
jgi:hypothetical protein